MDAAFDIDVESDSDTGNFWLIIDKYTLRPQDSGADLKNYIIAIHKGLGGLLDTWPEKELIA